MSSLRWVAPANWSVTYNVPLLGFGIPPHKYIVTVRHPFTVPEYTLPYGTVHANRKGRKNGTAYYPGHRVEVVLTSLAPGPSGGYLSALVHPTGGWINLGTIFNRHGFVRRRGFLKFCDWVLAPIAPELPPTAEVPMGVALALPKRECISCFDDFDLADGVECSGSEIKHFTCDKCLGVYVNGLVNAMDDTGRHVEREGRVLCPMHQECQSGPYVEKVLASHLADDLFKSYSPKKKIGG